MVLPVTRRHTVSDMSASVRFLVFFFLVTYSTQSLVDHDRFLHYLNIQRAHFPPGLSFNYNPEAKTMTELMAEEFINTVLDLGNITEEEIEEAQNWKLNFHLHYSYSDDEDVSYENEYINRASKRQRIQRDESEEEELQDAQGSEWAELSELNNVMPSHLESVKFITFQTNLAQYALYNINIPKWKTVQVYLDDRVSGPIHMVLGREDNGSLYLVRTEGCTDKMTCMKEVQMVMLEKSTFRASNAIEAIQNDDMDGFFALLKVNFDAL